MNINLKKFKKISIIGLILIPFLILGCFSNNNGLDFSKKIPLNNEESDETNTNVEIEPLKNDDEDFEKRVPKLILNKINEIRKNENLNEATIDESLTILAFNYSNYLKKNKLFKTSNSSLPQLIFEIPFEQVEGCGFVLNLEENIDCLFDNVLKSNFFLTNDVFGLGVSSIEFDDSLVYSFYGDIKIVESNESFENSWKELVTDLLKVQEETNFSETVRVFKENYSSSLFQKTFFKKIKNEVEKVENKTLPDSIYDFLREMNNLGYFISLGVGESMLSIHFNQNKTLYDYFSRKGFSVEEISNFPLIGIKYRNLILSKEFNENDIKLGDVISFKCDDDFVQHRILNIVRSNGKLISIKAKGDNNAGFLDCEKEIVPENILKKSVIPLFELDRNSYSIEDVMMNFLHQNQGIYFKEYVE